MDIEDRRCGAVQNTQNPYKIQVDRKVRIIVGWQNEDENTRGLYALYIYQVEEKEKGMDALPFYTVLSV